MAGWTRWVTAGLTLATVAFGGAHAQQAFQNPYLPEGDVRQVSPHVYVIMGFPNIGIVVGDEATLVVDTGLGNLNGALVAREARRLSTRNQKLILTTTHYHPEHASGQAGFPYGTLVVRDRAQQQELEADGQRMLDLFASRSSQMGSLLSDATIGKANTLFDHDLILDLGGIHAQLHYFGAAHTKGDEIVFIPEDSVLLPGDVVENRLSPNVICDSCSPRQWIAVLDEIAKLNPRHIVPDHGELGGNSLIAQERAFLADLDDKAVAAKRQGVPLADASKRIAADFQTRYAGWQGLGNVPQSVQRAYADPR